MANTDKKTAKMYGFTADEFNKVIDKAIDIDWWIRTTCNPQKKDVCDKIESVSGSIKEAIYITMSIKDMELVEPGHCDKCKEMIEMERKYFGSNDEPCVCPSCEEKIKKGIIKPSKKGKVK